METLYPTGTCFNDALDYLASLAKKLRAEFRSYDAIRRELLRHRLIHAICLHPNTDERSAHAWLEIDDEDTAVHGAIYRGERIYVHILKKEYRAFLRVQELTAYTFDEAMSHNQRTCSYGPWELRYLDLCRPQRLPGLP